MLVDQLDMAIAAEQRQKLSNELITPCSFTPLIKKTVTGTLFLRT